MESLWQLSVVGDTNQIFFSQPQTCCVKHNIGGFGEIQWDSVRFSSKYGCQLAILDNYIKISNSPDQTRPNKKVA